MFKSLLVAFALVVGLSACGKDMSTNGGLPPVVSITQQKIDSARLRLAVVGIPVAGYNALRPCGETTSSICKDVAVAAIVNGIMKSADAGLDLAQAALDTGGENVTTAEKVRLATLAVTAAIKALQGYGVG